MVAENVLCGWACNGGWVSTYVVHCVAQREPSMPNCVVSSSKITPSITPKVIGSRDRGYVVVVCFVHYVKNI